MGESVPVIRRRVTGHLAGHGISEALLASIQLAVSEAVTNSVVHAYRDAPQEGTVRVEVGACAEEVVVRVMDSGLGMSPRFDSPGLGLGLPLIARVADVCDLNAGDEHGGGTSLRMVFGLG